MNPFRTAIQVELRKAVASRVLGTTTILLVVGIGVLAGSLVAAARAGNAQILAQLGPIAGETGWTLLTGVTAQITAAGSLLAFGVALSWSFGREFSDGTITGLFALPVTRPIIALAKLSIHLLWTAGVAITLTAIVLAAGLLLQLGPVDDVVFQQLTRQAVLTLLAGMLAFPAGWAATLGRGPLPGIAATLAIVVVAQVVAIASPGTAGWLPLAAPGLWALQPDAVHAGQLALVAVVPAVFAALTALTWRRLRLDR